MELINDILDLSRIEAGRQEVRAAEVDLNELVPDVVASVEPLLRSDAVELLSEIDPGVGSVVSDGDKLRQILVNLLGNAIKFTESGNVAVSASGDDARVRLRVTDTGIGIAEDSLERIFEEFHQEDTAARAAGTGLGLTISRQLARLLGGDITASSVVGEGASFVVELPRTYEPPTASAA